MTVGHALSIAFAFVGLVVVIIVRSKASDIQAATRSRLQRRRQRPPEDSPDDGEEG